ncbi:hypothetical protein GBAR_LOCUS31367, partial [Geodia barretti]
METLRVLSSTQTMISRATFFRPSKKWESWPFSGRKRAARESNERFSKSLPNGGIQVLGSNSGDSSPQSSPTCDGVSPTPPPLLSPRTVSPLASEPPARAFPLPPALSPVHEGLTQQRKEPLVREDSVFTSDIPVSPASTVDSQQTTVFEESVETQELKSKPSTTMTQEEKSAAAGTITSDAAYPSAGYVASEKPFDNNADDGFTEFQSAPLVTHHQRAELVRAVSVDDGLQQEQKSSNKRVPLGQIAVSLSFDESKRMSMISVASADYYSMDEAGEEDEEEDNSSNYSAEFPELVCTVDYSAPVDPNPTEEEQHIFSTPPSSPPLSIEELKREKERRVRGSSSSDRSTSTSPRPKSASPLGHPRRSAIENLFRRSCSPRPKSAGTTSSCTTSSRGSAYEEVGEGTLVRHGHSSGTPQAGSASDPNTSENNRDEDKTTKVDTKDTPNNDSEAVVAADNASVARETDSAETPKPTPTVEATEEGGEEEEEEQFDESNEMFEDASEDTTSLEESCEMAASSRSTVSVEDTEKKKKEPLRKSQSANTSPDSTLIHKNTSSSSLTRSATDLGLKSKIKVLPGFHTRSRSTTLSLGRGPRRSLEEAPNRSKDEDYFIKLIRKTDPEATAAKVTAFSDQDFADILRSSLRGGKVPIVRVESADDRDDASAKTANDGGREGEVKGEGGSQIYLQAPRDDDGSPETAPVVPEPVEVIKIPEDVPPNMYLYQGVCTDDLAAILCAKVHGGDINFVNVDDEGKTPMLIAIEKVYTIHNYVVNSYKLDSFFKGKSASYRH